MATTEAENVIQHLNLGTITKLSQYEYANVPKPQKKSEIQTT